MAGHGQEIVYGHGHGLNGAALAPGVQPLQPLLLEGDQRMGNIFLFNHRDASFDRQLLGPAKMLLLVTGGKSVRRVLSTVVQTVFDPSKWRNAY